MSPVVQKLGLKQAKIVQYIPFTFHTFKVKYVK